MTYILFNGYPSESVSIAIGVVATIVAIIIGFRSMRNEWREYEANH